MKKILFIILLLSSITFGQRFFPQPIIQKVTPTVTTIDTTFTQNEVAELTLYIIGTQGSGILDSITFSVNLTYDFWEMPDSNTGVDTTTLGDWVETGWDSLLTNNSDSTYKFDNVPRELNDENTNFENWSYVDVLDGWDFTSGWAVANPNATIIDASSYSTIASSGVRINSLMTELDVPYVIKWGGTRTGTTLLACYSGAEGYIGSGSTTPFSQEVIDIPTIDGGFYCYNITASGTDTTVITELSAKKLVAPDGWTASTMDIDNYVIQDDEGLRLVSDGTNTYILLGSVLTVGKQYIRKFVIVEITGSIREFSGSAPSNYVMNSVGTHIDTFIATTTNVGIANLAGSCNAVISELSIKEYHPTSKISQPLPTEEGKYYQVEVSYSESETDLLDGWDFTSGWSATSTATIDDADSYTSTGVNGINKDSFLTDGKLYQMRIAGATTASYMKVFNFNGTSPYSGNISGTFDETFTFTASGTGIYLANFSAGTTDITAFRLYELDDSSQSVESAKLMYSWNGFIVDSSNTVTATAQIDTIGFWGAVENDYYSFDGVDDYITVADDNSLDFSEEMTLYLDIALDEYSSTQYLITKWYTVNGQRAYNLSKSATNANIVLWASSDGATSHVLTLSNTDSFVNGERYSIAITYDADNTILYVNSSPVDTVGSIGNLFNSPLPFSIGRYSSNYIGSSKIYNVKAYNKALSQSEVTTLYGGGSVTDSLVLDLNGTDGNISASTWSDQSGNGNDGTVSGATLVEPPQFEITTSDTGKVDFSIDGWQTSRFNLAYLDTLQLPITLETDSVGTFNESITATGNFSGSSQTIDVDYSVTPTENIFYAPTNLVASLITNGASLIWTDLNQQNIVTTYNKTFSDYTTPDEWTKTGRTYTEWDNLGGRIMLYDTLGGYTDWQSVYFTFNTSDYDYIDISVDADYMNTNGVWMVVAGYKNGSPTLLYGNDGVGSTKDTTFNYTSSSYDYDSTRVYLQIYADSSEYAFFDDFVVKTKEAGYDEIYIEKNLWVKGIGQYWNTATPSEWEALTNYTSVDTTYFHSSSVMHFESGDDTTKYSYRVRFKKDGEYSSYSNLDTLMYIKTTTPSVGELLAADIYIHPDSIGNTWADVVANPADTTYAIILDTLNNHWDDLGDVSLAAVIAFSDTNIGRVDIANVDDITFTGWYANDSTQLVTMVDTLLGWNDSSNWTYVGTGFNGLGYEWEYDLTGTNLYDKGLVRLFLVDSNSTELIEYPKSVNDQLVGVNISGYTLTDTVWFQQVDSVFRWSSTTTYADAHRITIWTPNNTNPATYYENMKTNAYYDGLTTNSAAIVFSLDNCDNVTFKHFVIEGGFKGLYTSGCDDLTIDSMTFQGTNYRSFHAENGDNITVSNSRFKGIDGMYGSYYPQEGCAAEAITVAFLCDSTIIEYNTISSYSTNPIMLLGADPEGRPTNGIIRYNHIYDNEGRWYHRGLQVTAAAGASSSFSPLNTIVAGNLFEDTSVGSKLGGDGTLYAYNVFANKTQTWDVVVDHYYVKTGNDGNINEGLSRSINVDFIHNTFYNSNLELDKYTPYSIRTAHFTNNLFIDINTSNRGQATSWYWTTGITNPTYYYNNYSYTSARPDEKVLYVGGTEYDWADINNGSVTNVFGASNLWGSVTAVSQIFNSDYEINVLNADVTGSSANINLIGQDYSYTLPSWLTTDYYGNPIDGTSDNIGAVNN